MCVCEGVGYKVTIPIATHLEQQQQHQQQHTQVVELPAPAATTVAAPSDTTTTTLIDGTTVMGANDLRRRLSALSSIKGPLQGPIKSKPVADALRGRNLQTYGFSPAPQQPRNVEWFGRCGGIEDTCQWNPWAFCQDAANPMVRCGFLFIGFCVSVGI